MLPGKVAAAPELRTVSRAVAYTSANTILFGEPTLVQVLGSYVQPGSQPYDAGDDESRIAVVETTYSDLPVQNFVTHWPQLLLD
jgi:hypothetical protein